LFFIYFSQKNILKLKKLKETLKHVLLFLNPKTIKISQQNLKKNLCFFILNNNNKCFFSAMACNGKQWKVQHALAQRAGGLGPLRGDRRTLVSSQGKGREGREAPY